VRDFLVHLPGREQRQVVERLLRRLLAGEPLSARKVSDQVDESCEFLANLLEFCSDMEIVESVLNLVSPAAANAATADTLGAEFIASRRKHRLTPFRTVGAWEEHFSHGERYFYNHERQITQREVPEEWPADEEVEMSQQLTCNGQVVCQPV